MQHAIMQAVLTVHATQALLAMEYCVQVRTSALFSAMDLKNIIIVCGTLLIQRASLMHRSTVLSVNCTIIRPYCKVVPTFCKLQALALS